MRIVILALATCMTTSGLHAQVAVTVEPLEMDWTTTLDEIVYLLDFTVGERFVAACPAAESVETIWGTGTYTSDSPICVAATHAGALSAQRGGTVLVEVAPGLGEYAGSIRHGISSSSYPAWDLSFRFPEAPQVAATGGFQANWYTSPRSVGAASGQRVWMVCAGGRSGGSVWGTDVYTDDSSICEAAVHAGLITRAEGGRVDLEMLGAQPSFHGSTRNGVSTHDYPTWPGSFRFVAIEE
ncbi:MAG TPA: LCCL domain-containing protein [Gemmatimonadota bacterium]|nr:LCCL domain-containing protein [Gemmatimonadota bacterium]